MRQRLAIIISATVTAAVLAVGLSAAGLGPSSGFATDDGTGADGTATAVEAGPEPEVVYVKPAPKQRTVVVTQRVAQRDTSTKSTKGAKSGPAARSSKASKSGTKAKSAAQRNRGDDDRDDHDEDEKHERERDEHEEDDD